jgi:hypothetical protein
VIFFVGLSYVYIPYYYATLRLVVYPIQYMPECEYILRNFPKLFASCPNLIPWCCVQNARFFHSLCQSPSMKSKVPEMHMSIYMPQIAYIFVIPAHCCWGTDPLAQSASSSASTYSSCCHAWPSSLSSLRHRRPHRRRQCFLPVLSLAGQV